MNSHHGEQRLGVGELEPGAFSTLSRTSTSSLSWPPPSADSKCCRGYLPPGEPLDPRVPPGYLGLFVPRFWLPRVLRGAAARRESALRTIAAVARLPFDPAAAASFIRGNQQRSQRGVGTRAGAGRSTRYRAALCFERGCSARVAGKFRMTAEDRLGQLVEAAGIELGHFHDMGAASRPRRSPQSAERDG